MIHIRVEAPAVKRIIIGFLLTAATTRAESVALINAATLYSPVFSNINDWTTAHPDFSFSATNVSSAAADAAYAVLSPHIAAMSSARNANYCDWGVKFEEGFAATLPHLAPLRKVGRAANWAAAYADARGEFAKASEFAMEALRVGRNAGEDRLLISLLMQISMEKPALEHLTKLVAKMDATSLDKLVTGIGAMPPGATVIEAMEMEKALMVDQMLRDLMELIREASSNAVFASELGMTGITNALASSESESGSGVTIKSWLAENLRLTSIVDLGGRYKLGFETKDGDSFVLALGRPQRGIELVSADFTREEAIISRGNETALVKLKSREITPIVLNFRLPDAKKLQAIAAQSGNGKYKALSAFVSNMAQLDPKDGDAAFARDIAVGGADGLVGLLRGVSDDYAKWIDAYKTMPHDKFKEWQKTFIEHQVNPMTKMVLPSVDRCIDKEIELRSARDALTAAVAARRAQLP